MWGPMRMHRRIRATSYDAPVRGRSVGILSAVAFLAACSAASGAQPRGTIDGVVLHPPSSAAAPGQESTTTRPPRTTTSTTLPDLDLAIDWSNIGDGLEEGYLEVPLDWSDTEGPRVQLYLVRHLAERADQRIGTLLVNPGGPGYGGSGLADNATDIYGQDLLDRFDIVGWDPRGTGFSEPHLDCTPSVDFLTALDSSPDDEAERTTLVAAAADLADRCARSGEAELLPFMSTEDSAKDMDAIRQALNEDTISYFGFSWGSELGATWATMFPDTVRAAVLDGAADPTVDYVEQNVQQAAGVETAFDLFLQRCAARSSCRFAEGGDPAQAFDELWARIDETPVPSDDPQRPAVTQGVLTTAIASAMYDEAAWPDLEAALADLQTGDPGGILDFYDTYYGRSDGQTDDGNEAYFATNCIDRSGLVSVEAAWAAEERLAAAAPRLGRGWVAELLVCAQWSEPPRDAVRITGDGAGPILVVGTTGDPITPYEGSRRMAERLEEGRLLSVEGQQHTAYGLSRCGDDAIEGYLLDPTAPLGPLTTC